MHITSGDAAVALLKAGAEVDKRDSDGQLALDLAPDKEVCSISIKHSSLDALSRLTIACWNRFASTYSAKLRKRALRSSDFRG